VPKLRWLKRIAILAVMGLMLAFSSVSIYGAVLSMNDYKQIGISNDSMLYVGTDNDSYLYVGRSSGTNNTGLAVLADYTLPDTSVETLGSNPEMPVQMYQELDTTKVPLAPIVDAILAESDTPPALWWFPFIFFGLGIFGLLMYGLTCKNGATGSELVLTIVIEAGLVIFGIIGTSGGSLIPLFPAFIFPIPAIAIIISKKTFSW
jgi:hypothetical protein